MSELKLELIKKAIEEKKGEDIEVYDVHESSPFFDYVVLCTCSNVRQGAAIADEIDDSLSKNADPIRNIEGKNKDSEWVLVDCGDIIVHILSKYERIRINLEELLAKAGEKR